MSKRHIILIGLGTLIVASVIILAITMTSKGDDKSTIQENTKEIFTEEKTQKIEKTLEKNNKSNFSSQEF